jgi:very-short-patch-repair endonuclease
MSRLEDILDFHMRAAGLPTPVREMPFAKPRMWRFDFAWPDQMIAMEVDGGTFNGGGHVRGRGVAKDCEKACEAAIRGWRVLRVDGDQVRDGRALEWARRALLVDEDKSDAA